MELEPWNLNLIDLCSNRATWPLLEGTEKSGYSEVAFGLPRIAAFHGVNNNLGDLISGLTDLEALGLY